MRLFYVWIGLTLASALGGMTRAETFDPPDAPPVCGAGWWLERTDVPLTVKNTPLTATLLLPVEWGLDPFEADLSGLSVVVTTPAGAVVAGSLIHGPALVPAGLVRWRPDQPLAAATSYEVRFRVAAAPSAMPVACGYTAFDRVLTLKTGDGADLAASLAEASIASNFSPDGRWLVEAEVCGGEFDARCPARPEVCCFFDQVGLRGDMVAAVTIASLGRNAPIYYMLDMTLSNPDGTQVVRTQESVIDGGVYELTSPWLQVPNEFVGDGICMTATLTDVLAGRVVATVERCGVSARANDPVPGPDVLTCPSSSCFGADPETPDADADTAGGGAEVWRDRPIETPTPAEESGCGGGTSSGLGGLAALILALGRRIRRAGSLRTST